ncbi:putative quinol monooxygenase [Flavobacterium sp.]|uniref:putative quinol monooxygenase n=1 Tax=Flavobacterium sp. TaxID=239 RepID=UPI002FDAAFDD
MKTRNRLFVKSILILTTLLFAGWSLKNKTEIDNTKNIIVLVKYKTQPSKENETVLALTNLIESVKKEPHFVNIKLHIDPKDRTNILLYEEWDDELYYKSKHMQTNHLQKFIGDSKNFLAGPPEITFWKVEKEFK